MSKYRIYELAKEFDTTSKVIIDILARNSMIAKNHMSSVDDDAKEIIDRTFARKVTETQPNVEHVMQNNAVKEQTIIKQPEINQTKPSQPVSEAQSTEPIEPKVQQPTLNNQPNNVQGVQGNVERPRQPLNNQVPPQGQVRNPQPNQPQQQNQQRPPYNQQFRSQPSNNQQRPPQQFQQNNNRPQQNQPNNNFNRPVDQQRPPQQFQPNNNRPQQNQPNNNFNRPLDQQRPPQQFQPNNNRPADQQRPPQQFQSNNRPADQNRPQQTQQPRFNAAGTTQNRAPFKPSAPVGNNQPPNQAGQKNQPFNNTRKPQQYGQNRPQQNRSQGARHNNVRQVPLPPKIEPPKPKAIKVGDSITVKDLSIKLAREVSEVIKKLMMMGVMATINQEVDFDTATLLAGEFGATVEQLPPEEDPTEIAEIEDDEATLVLRPPVVTVMGHVDHGKTSLLDSIRKTHVTTQEAGGITQHIGAYQVICHGKRIVFLDTPGHEAFTSMRARGAQVTDIAILVVAADDGVMPQTIEAINHSKAAKVPIIVAINKIDRPGANPDRVKQQLSDHGLVPEDWGGDTVMVPVSAHKKTGIDELLEMILLVAEMQEIKANPNRAAIGTIIEAQLDKGRGPVATVLIQKGTLRIGDSIIAGTAFGKVRAMINDRGEKVKKAEPSTPVEVLGLASVPQAGDVLVAVEERVARAVAEKRIAKKRTDDLQQSQKVSLDDLFKQIQEGNIKDLNVVVKADVQGSIEALRQALIGLNSGDNEEVRVVVVHAGVGAINESDVMLASASNALIIGFNVRPDANARKAAENEKIDIRLYRIIYEALNDVQAAMTGMLAPKYKEVIQGRVEIRQVFLIDKNIVAGSYVLEGKITNNSQVRIIRDSIVVHEGAIESLRRFKDSVKEVATGYECGVSIEKFRDLKEGDIIEAFAMEEIKNIV